MSVTVNSAPRRRAACSARRGDSSDLHAEARHGLSRALERRALRQFQIGWSRCVSSGGACAWRLRRRPTSYWCESDEPDGRERQHTGPAGGGKHEQNRQHDEQVRSIPVGKGQRDGQALEHDDGDEQEPCRAMCGRACYAP